MHALHWQNKFGVHRQWLATIIEPMFEVYVLLFIGAALALTGWWILRKSVPTRQSAGGTERSASRNIIDLCAVLLIIVGGACRSLHGVGTISDHFSPSGRLRVRADRLVDLPNFYSKQVVRKYGPTNLPTNR